MKSNREKIIEVLTIIKETCAENACATCPFSNRGNCLIPSGGSIPEEWELNTITRRLYGGKQQ